MPMHCIHEQTLGYHAVVAIDNVHYQNPWMQRARPSVLRGSWKCSEEDTMSERVEQPNQILCGLVRAEPHSTAYL
jgi:hypothetical protein